MYLVVSTFLHYDLITFILIIININIINIYYIFLFVIWILKQCLLLRF